MVNNSNFSIHIIISLPEFISGSHSIRREAETSSA